jgi:hypothetical protein
MLPQDDNDEENDNDDDNDWWSSNNNFLSQYFNNKGKKLNEREYEEIYYHFDTVAQNVLLANANLLLAPPEPGKLLLYGRSFLFFLVFAV